MASNWDEHIENQKILEENLRQNPHIKFSDPKNRILYPEEYVQYLKMQVAENNKKYGHTQGVIKSADPTKPYIAKMINRQNALEFAKKHPKIAKLLHFIPVVNLAWTDMKADPDTPSERKAVAQAAATDALSLTGLGKVVKSAGAIPAVAAEVTGIAGAYGGSEVGEYLVQKHDAPEWTPIVTTIIGGGIGGGFGYKLPGKFVARGIFPDKAVQKGLYSAEYVKAPLTRMFDNQIKTASPETYLVTSAKTATVPTASVIDVKDTYGHAYKKYKPLINWDLDHRAKISEGERSGLTRHERTNIRTSPKLSPEAAFETRLGQIMSWEFTDPGIKDVVRKNPSAGMIMKKWMNDGMSEIDAYKQYLTERSSVTRVVGVPASSIEDGIRIMNASGEKMARELRNPKNIMNGDLRIAKNEAGIYTSDYNSGRTYGGPDFTLKSHYGPAIKNSELPKVIYIREYLLSPKMNFLGDPSTWLKKNLPIASNAEQPLGLFSKKFKKLLDDVSAETGYDYSNRLLYDDRYYVSPRREIVFTGKPGELLQMKPVRHRDSYFILNSSVNPEGTTHNDFSRNYLGPGYLPGDTPWSEYDLKTVPFKHKHGGKITKQNEPDQNS